MSYDIRHAFLAEKIYSVGKKNIDNSFVDPTGQSWVLRDFDTQSNGYQAGLFQNTATGELVLANRGTEISPLKPIETIADLYADAVMGVVKLPGQMTSADAFYDNLSK